MVLGRMGMTRECKGLLALALTAIAGYWIVPGGQDGVLLAVDPVTIALIGSSLLSGFLGARKRSKSNKILREQADRERQRYQQLGPVREAFVARLLGEPMDIPDLTSVFEDRSNPFYRPANAKKLLGKPRALAPEKPAVQPPPFDPLNQLDPLDPPGPFFPGRPGDPFGRGF